VCTHAQVSGWGEEGWTVGRASTHPLGDQRDTVLLVETWDPFSPSKAVTARFLLTRKEQPSPCPRCPLP
jgi:hypothetical protein